MNKLAYFDCEFGAAGDMLNGALVAAGVSINYIVDELGKLGLPPKSFELNAYDVVRCQYACKKFNVLTGPGKDYESGLFPDACHPVDSSSTDEESLKFAVRATDTAVLAKKKLCPGTLAGILSLVRDSDLAEGVKELASEIFEQLYKAEALTRGEVVDQLDMQEMMALDAIIDIVGFAIAYKSLAIEKAFVSPLPLGSGTFDYGGVLYSGASPATLELIKNAGAPVSSRVFNNECLTVTGAAILTTIASGWARPFFGKIDGIGYGAGTYDPATYPNACRVLIGEALEGPGSENPNTENQTESERFQSEQILVLEANIDDLPPQSLAYAAERLLDSGALDVLVLPVVMKKGRSGHLLKVLCNLHDRQKMQELMFNETSTIGVRSYVAERVLADRRWQDVIMDDQSSIRVKVAVDKFGAMVHAQPEYEDCARYAKKHGLPLKNVITAVLARFNSVVDTNSSDQVDFLGQNSGRDRSD